MRAQFIIVACLVSLIAWVGVFHGARELYRTGQEAGVIPNLHLKHQLDMIL